MANIKKVKLSNGQIYSFFDEGAMRVDPTTHKLLTGSAVVDSIIIEDMNLFITEIDDVPVEQSIENVLVQDTTTGEIKKRTVNKLLEDIGGITCDVSNAGTLTFKIGK